MMTLQRWECIVTLGMSGWSCRYKLSRILKIVTCCRASWQCSLKTSTPPKIYFWLQVGLLLLWRLGQYDLLFLKLLKGFSEVAYVDVEETSNVYSLKVIDFQHEMLWCAFSDEERFVALGLCSAIGQSLKSRTNTFHLQRIRAAVRVYRRLHERAITLWEGNYERRKSPWTWWILCCRCSQNVYPNGRYQKVRNYYMRLSMHVWRNHVKRGIIILWNVTSTYVSKLLFLYLGEWAWHSKYQVDRWRRIAQQYWRVLRYSFTIWI